MIIANASPTFSAQSRPVASAGSPVNQDPVDRYTPVKAPPTVGQMAVKGGLLLAAAGLGAGCGLGPGPGSVAGMLTGALVGTSLGSTMGGFEISMLAPFCSIMGLLVITDPSPIFAVAGAIAAPAAVLLLYKTSQES